MLCSRLSSFEKEYTFMKKIVFLVFLILVVSGIWVIYGNTRNSAVATDPAKNIETPAKPKDASREKAGRPIEFEKTDLRSLDQTGICSRLAKDGSLRDLPAGAVEETLDIDSDRQVVFRTVCETGPGEDGSGVSVKRDLYVLLRVKSPKGGPAAEEIINKYTVTYPGADKPDFPGYPFILDAEASNDGRTLRYIAGRSPEYYDLYQYDLTRKDWKERYALNSYTISRFFVDSDQPISVWHADPLKQAYFLKPDVVYIATEKRDVRIAEQIRLDNREAKRKAEEFYKSPDYLSGKYKGTGLPRHFMLTGVYWNRKGDERQLAARWNMFDGEVDGLKKLIEPGTLANASFVSRTKPVPTERDWEGWHKLVRKP